MTEWVIKYASYLMCDLADSFRLWFIPPAVRKYVRELDLPFVIGSEVDYTELLEIVDVVDGINWMDMTVGQDRRGSRVQDASLCSVSTGGDFVLYDPYLKCIVDGDTARYHSKFRSVNSDKLPSDFLYVPEGSLSQLIDSQGVEV